MITTRRIDIGDSYYYCLSNFSAHQVLYKGRLYSTSEHAYQASKFLNSKKEFADRVWWDILNSKSPYEAKKIAHSNRGSYRHEWNFKKFKVFTMRKILLTKVEQHEDVREVLLVTGDKEIIEITNLDLFWGQSESGLGINWLGKVWMGTRDDIRNKS